MDKSNCLGLRTSAPERVPEVSPFPVFIVCR
jgi:hypothetical protein